MGDNGRIDTVLEPEAVAAVLDLLDQLERALPFMLVLSKEEKQHLAKPRAGTKQVAESVAEIQAEAGMPVAADDPMLADLGVYLGLTTIADRLAEVQQKVDDTRMQAGAEAWKEGLIRYGMLRQMARSKSELTPKLDRIQPLIKRPARRTRDEQPAEPATEQG